MPIKGSTLLLGASLTVNAALSGVMVCDQERPFLFHLGHCRIPNLGMPRSAASPAVPEGSGTRAPSAPAMAALLSGDLKTLGARLRAAGFPPNIIRALIQAKIDELFRARRRELFAQSKMNPYWSKNFSNLDPDTLAKMGAMNKERTDMQKELLPDDPTMALLNPWQKNMNGSLPPEKIQRVQAINSDYTDLKNEIYSSAKGTLLPEDIEKLNLLDREQQSDMAEALSPNELFEYQIRNSPTSQQMRYSLQAFNPTEDEYRAIFKVQQAFDQQYGASNTPLTSDQNAERQKHQGEVLDQLKGVLSPERLEEYKEENGPGLSEREPSAVSPGSAYCRHQTGDGYPDRHLQAGRRHTPGQRASRTAERTSQLSALADEATTKATSIVGDRGFEAYRLATGNWIQSLKPPAN